MEQKVAHLPPPMTTLIVRDYGNDPYLILISCLLSLRSRDAATYAVSKELFEYAKTPQEMIALPLTILEKILRPIGFYQRKSVILKEVSKELLECFDGKVPHTESDLLSIKHIGRKTANLVLSVAFDIPAICVDTHVHRIANHLGLVKTTTPEETESALKKIIPKTWWSKLNYIFVVWGQNICKPQAKKCHCFQAFTT
jgi:endonuclease-3